LIKGSTLHSLAVETLSVRGLRNLAAVDLALGERFNVLAGDNGQGKTNLLEAVYLLATSRSFRTSRLSDLVANAADVASVRATLRENGESRVQSVGVRAGYRAVRIDGKKPSTLAAYAVRTPIVVFHPGVLSLTLGSGAERRKLLDRVALYQSPSSLGDLEGYGRALRARQRALETRGENAVDLVEWEDLLVRHGLAMSGGRARAAERLGPRATAAFRRIGPPDVELGMRYQRSAPEGAGAFRAMLEKRRREDRARGSASVGPHRDDVLLTLGNRPTRGIASQGQHRAVVLALELAEMQVIAEARGARPILLLDDVSSELDRSRTAALFVALREEAEGQVIVTTTRPELVDTGGSSGELDRRDFKVVGGQVMPS
jgi:DNA replication and repair protein RecF